MIKKIQIDHFKSIHNMEIKLSNVNIFIGANGVGKSNILEAIGVVSSALTGTVDDEALIRRGVRAGVPRLYKTSSKRFATYPHIGFSLSDNSYTYKVSLLNPLKKPLPKWSYKTESISINGYKTFTRGVRGKEFPDMGYVPNWLINEQFPSSAVDFVQSIKDYAIYNPNTLALRGVVSDNQMRLPVGLSGGGLADAFRKLVRQSDIDDDLSEEINEVISMFDWIKMLEFHSILVGFSWPSVPRPKSVLVFDDKYMDINSNSLTAFDASEGVLYVLFLMILCLSEDGPNVFSVDNIDQAMNPRLVKALVGRMIYWFNELVPEKQILCTAHNPSILDAIGVNSPSVKIFIVDRDSYGATIIKELIIDEEIINISKDKNMPLSRLWVEGFLGGVPNV